MTRILGCLGRIRLVLAALSGLLCRLFGRVDRLGTTDTVAAERVLPAARKPEARGRRGPHRARRGITVAALAGAVVLVAALGAIAYWTTGGTGTASASAGTLSAATISAPGTTTGNVAITWDSQAAMTPASQNNSITYTVEREFNGGGFAPIGGGGCSSSFAFNTASCTDAVGTSGTYKYRVVAHFLSAWTAASNEVTVTANLDNTPPTVSSITRNDTNPTNASSVQWTVTFTENVTGVNAPDFALVGAGAIGASITSATGSNSSYTLTVATGADGTLGLNLVDDDSIEDLAANKLGGTGAGNGSFTGQTYTVDRTAPSVSSITRDGVSPTNAATVSWTVTFNESVSGVNVSDFTLTASGLNGSPSVQSVTAITAATYTVTSTTGTGTPSGSGTLRLDVTDDDSIVDTLGNKLGGTGTGNGNFTTGDVYTIDKTQPLVTVEQKVGQADPTNALPIRFTVTFSESVTGFDASDLTRIGTTTGGSVAVTGSGASYEIVITNPSTTLTNGTIGFTIAASKAIDTAGNDNLASTSIDNQVTYDTAAPVVTLAATGSANGAGWRNAPFTVSASATDSLSGVASCQANVNYSGPDTATGSITRTCTDNAGNIGSATFTFKYDATNPTVTLAASPASPNGTNGWYKSAVTWTPSQTDATSGAASCQAAIVYSTPDSATASVTRTCTDNAGNVGSATATFKYDGTAPTVTLSPSPASPNGTNGWYKSTATWTPSQTDATSGAASCEAALAYSAPDSATASVTRTCTDNAGNTGSASQTFKYDGTAPTGTVTAPAGGASVSGSAVAVTSTSATDTTSAVASVQFQVKPSAGAFANLGAADTTPPYAVSWDTTAIANGAYVLQAIITDNAGNTTTTASINVTVANVYTFVIGTIGNQTAGTAFGGFTVQLQINGSNSSTFNGAAYTGAKAMTYSGTAAAAAPSGTTATASSSVSFTNGVATVPAGAITLVKAATNVSLIVADSTGSPTIGGTSNTFNVAAGAPARLAWNGVTITGGTLSSLCLFTCTWTGANNKDLSANVTVTDSHGNIVSGVGSGHSASLTLSGTPALGTVTPASVTFPAAGSASAAFSYNAPTGTWGPVTLTAATTAGTVYTSATISISK